MRQGIIINIDFFLDRNTKNLIIIKTQFITNIFRFFVFLSRKMSI